MIEGSVKADTFEEFIEKSLFPNLCPFNGTNAHSVVVMDNCSVMKLLRVLIAWLRSYQPIVLI